MGPDKPLPFSKDFTSVDDYIDSLLRFSTTSWLFQTLCGGVHILDFYTRTPDLYSTILPETWRTWFKDHDIMDILDLLMREDLGQFDVKDPPSAASIWRGGPAPPEDLLDYIRTIRRHLLVRDFPMTESTGGAQKSTIARHVAVGMKVKKVHEVDNFARYVDGLTTEIAASGKKEITHLVDFGSGQNYLGRALAATPYSKHIVAVESKQHNIEGAKNMDVLAKLVPKPLVMRNKKEFRSLKNSKKEPKPSRRENEPNSDATSVPEPVAKANPEAPCESGECEIVISPSPTATDAASDNVTDRTIVPGSDTATAQDGAVTTTLQIYRDGNGSVQYVEHIIQGGDLSPVVKQILDSSDVKDHNLKPQTKIVEEPSDLTAVPRTKEPNLMVISLHSCGNLVHHGLRSLLLNPAVSAVAMVGCCYNLLTERLGPPTYKLPTLRSNHPRLASTSNAFDPNGFPMSEKLATYSLPHPAPEPSQQSSGSQETLRGLRLNITARMMAVQAPFNWGAADSDLFFTRHFYRALLQRIFLDRGVVAAPTVSASEDSGAVSASGHSSKVNWTPPNGRGPGLSSDGTVTPLTIGTLRKFAYNDFVSYVRAAIAKLTSPNSFCEVDPAFITSNTESLTDDEIREYEAKYREKKKELSVMWALMAFSAGVVEAIIVTDRYLWLKEQEEIETAWAEPVFEYGLSPRNLVVVGIKK
ncbi:hypothetical protein M011DRAFT_410965 [Sporormia fimetaria CBS 119925]|uniref:Methyltransferase domain-containing protein n=1 Tax=Sporormia fimetaria CBS 119925 TaxID=1340428 RepID=A0A6A6V0J7_9PLEO|nr:hypothetical protein M011DRAFT_410965 [Sporormia fimetaria CBS 119925]